MKRRLKKKLYSKIRDVLLPESILEFRGGGSHTYRIDFQRIPIAAHVTWPSGKPCEAVNMYLLDKSWSFTGESALSEASKLTELIRYCSSGRVNRKPIGFSELNDGDIGLLIKALCSEAYPNEPTMRVRNNNTVRSIMHSVFNFLFWYQNNLFFGAHPLIGTRSEGAVIIVQTKLNARSNRYYFDHRYLPPSESTDPKLPMGMVIIEEIEKVVEDLENPENYPAAAMRRFKCDEKYFSVHLAYLAARRTFMLFLLKATGLRPAEMVSMPLDKNTLGALNDPPVLILPNLKQRRSDPPLRTLQITPTQAMHVRLYLRARIEWLKFLKSRNPDSTAPDSMFISATADGIAKPVSKSALEKDFEMLCNKAGYRDQQTCFSMFRHRYITDLLSMHLKAFDQQVGVLNKHDYRTLLEKVREKTGHKSIDSLWHYIDLVRDCAGVWKPVELIKSRIDAAEHLNFEVRELRKEMKNRQIKNMSADEVISLVIGRLNNIIGSD